MNEERSAINLNKIAERACRWAILCGITPFLLGMVVFLVWWKTSWLSLVNAGMLNVITGLLFVSFGLIYLIRLWILTQWMLTLRSPRKFRLILSGLALFAANFIGAAAVLLAMIMIQTAFSVEVRNQSRDTIRNAELVGGVWGIVFDRAIPPGGVSRRTQWIKHDNEELTFKAQSDHRVYREYFPYYVTSNLGGLHLIVIHSNHSVSLDVPPDDFD